jgi:hypothetical protein
MRALAAATILFANAAWSIDSSRRAPLEDGGLTTAQVEHYANAYQPGIRACYAAQAEGVPAATGKLQLEAIVLRNGELIVVSVQAPGITGARLKALDTCIRAEVETWRFPVSPYDTSIQIPYWFHRVEVPGAGPAFSCWNPRGCRTAEKRWTR